MTADPTACMHETITRRDAETSTTCLQPSSLCLFTAFQLPVHVLYSFPLYVLLHHLHRFSVIKYQTILHTAGLVEMPRLCIAACFGWSLSRHVGTTTTGTCGHLAQLHGFRCMSCLSCLMHKHARLSHAQASAQLEQSIAIAGKESLSAC